ncbi:MAG: carbohydrate ABC transporter permease, partial [Syntrophothermus sp.]
MPGIFRQTEQARKTLFKQGAVYVLLSGGAFVLLLPLFYMISTAFKPFTYIFEIPPQFFPKEPTVDNFVRAWTSNYFAHYFANSLLVAAATTVLSAALSSMLAFPFARFRFPGREALFAILLVPMMIPSMVLIIPQFVLAKSLGLLNSLW